MAKLTIDRSPAIVGIFLLGILHSLFVFGKDLANAKVPFKGLDG